MAPYPLKAAESISRVRQARPSDWFPLALLQPLRVLVSATSDCHQTRRTRARSGPDWLVQRLVQQLLVEFALDRTLHEVAVLKCCVTVAGVHCCTTTKQQQPLTDTEPPALQTRISSAWSWLLQLRPNLIQRCSTRLCLLCAGGLSPSVVCLSVSRVTEISSSVFSSCAVLDSFVIVFIIASPLIDTIDTGVASVPIGQDRRCISVSRTAEPPADPLFSF